MHPIEIVILLLTVVVAVSIFGKKLKIVFPVLLTLTGLLIGFVPGLPEIALDPSIVLLVFLPPILYAAAWYTNWKDFKRNLEPITVLALGLVIATCVGIAYTANYFIPEFTLALGFLLGAVISPPDAVAATAVLKRVKVPRKIVTVLEGESLVNDASALIAFQFALAAITTGQFSLVAASGKFLLVASGGIVVGLLVGYTAYKIHKHFSMEPALETMLTFVTAYGAYLAAEQFHLNGVLSVVTAGLFMGSKQSKIHSPTMRIQAVAVWDFVMVFLNGLIFVLIGLQLPFIIAHIKGEKMGALIFYGVVISVAATVIRFGYVFLADFVSGRIRKAIGMAPVFPSYKHTTILAFTAMRGVVSLAAAFSIPVLIDNGTAFPKRDVLLFVTFCVVVFTLILQGLALPWLIRVLNFKADEKELAQHHHVRQQLSQDAFSAIEAIVQEESITTATADRIKEWHRQKLFQHIAGNEIEAENDLQIALKLQRAGINARRNKLVHLREQGEIDIELFHELENELDLEEAAMKTLKST